MPSTGGKPVTMPFDVSRRFLCDAGSSPTTKEAAVQPSEKDRSIEELLDAEARLTGKWPTSPSELEAIFGDATNGGASAPRSVDGSSARRGAQIYVATGSGKTSTMRLRLQSRYSSR